MPVLYLHVINYEVSRRTSLIRSYGMDDQQMPQGVDRDADRGCPEGGCSEKL
jgi:hypothetical protein